jgi:hypothetical protein
LLHTFASADATSSACMDYFHAAISRRLDLAGVPFVGSGLLPLPAYMSDDASGCDPRPGPLVAQIWCQCHASDLLSAYFPHACPGWWRQCNVLSDDVSSGMVEVELLEPQLAEYKFTQCCEHGALAMPACGTVAGFSAGSAAQRWLVPRALLCFSHNDPVDFIERLRNAYESRVDHAEALFSLHSSSIQRALCAPEMTRRYELHPAQVSVALFLS